MSFKKLALEHGEFETTLSRKFQERKPYEPPNPNRLKAFLPGTIQSILVAPQANVHQGDTLMTLEAMKMENRVLAPCDGVVKQIHVKVGDMVTKNALLVEIEG